MKKHEKIEEIVDELVEEELKQEGYDFEDESGRVVFSKNSSAADGNEETADEQPEGEEKEQRSIGKILIILGLIFVISAVGLVVINLAIDILAGIKAANAVDTIEEIIVPSDGTVQSDLRGAPGSMTIEGQSYIGILRIPALGLNLPVIETWSYPSLRVAPCRVAGNAFDKNLVIAGHNYSNHFGNLKNLQPGDAVYFEDVEGNGFSYTVVDKEIIGKYDEDTMKAGEWDLTLFTCTIGGAQRVTIRCKEGH